MIMIYDTDFFSEIRQCSLFPNKCHTHHDGDDCCRHVRTDSFGRKYSCGKAMYDVQMFYLVNQLATFHWVFENSKLCAFFHKITHV